MNKVFLLGNLTRDPELRHTADGTPVVTFSMALNRQYQTKAGEKKNEVCFVDIVAWNKAAEFIANNTSKGSSILVEGHLVLSQWETKEGDKRSKLKVQCDRFQIIQKRKEANDTITQDSKST